MSYQVFSDDSAKAIKARDYGFLNAIHYLAPAKLSGYNLCPHASPGCAALCLGWYSGQVGMVKHDRDRNNVRTSRLKKSKRFMTDRPTYVADIVASIISKQRKAAALGLKLCVRLNGSSDIAWEGVRCEHDGKAFRNIFEAFPNVQFVGYTKNPLRMTRALPANYSLTFSRSELNEKDCLKVLAAGKTVAIVFRTKPAAWHGYPVVDGDLHDLRHLDPAGHVIALSPKGTKVKKDKSGFVIN
jgi:hypothetical protein